MGPRPYSENSTIPESASNEPLTPIPTQILMETPTPSTTSSATTPSPTPQEIIPVEQHVDAVVIQDDGWGDGTIPCFPSPGDMMPYDHSLPDFIRQITNQTNLANLHSLSLRVISTCISLHRMSAYLPNLKELDLEGSILNSLRDIGCSFKNLQILKVGRCQLESLDGTFGLSTLRELYAEKNFINDVSPCSNLPHIKHIDVSWNRIRNISYAGFLSVCSKLKSIKFTGNPATEVTDYRKHVRRILPQIESLDGVPFSNDNPEESKESELIENFDNESNSSTEITDFNSISPSNSLNNLLDSEDDIICLEKRCKQGRNVANQDQCKPETQDLPGPSKKFDIQDDLKNLSLQRSSEGILGRPKATLFTETRVNSINKKCTSIQKLDKDVENRSKKSNFLSQSNSGEDFVSLPEIIPCPKSKPTLLKPPEGLIPFLNSESVIESSKQHEQRECKKFQIVSTDDNLKSSDEKSGAIKKIFSISSIPPPSPGCSSAPDIILEPKINLVNSVGSSSLTSGLPIRGNLTAALRNRNKQQENKEFLKATLESLINEDFSSCASTESNLNKPKNEPSNNNPSQSKQPNLKE